MQKERAAGGGESGGSIPIVSLAGAFFTSGCVFATSRR
jgi:hypothetical protein